MKKLLISLFVACGFALSAIGWGRPVERLGVPIRFETEATSLDEFADADLVVVEVEDADVE